MSILARFQQAHPLAAAAAYFVFAYLALCVPPVVWVVKNGGSPVSAVGYSAVNLCLYCLPVIILRKHLRKYLQGLALLAPFIPATFVAANFQMPLDYSALLYALDAGTQNNADFVRANLWSLLAIIPLAVSLMLLPYLIPSKLEARVATGISSFALLALIVLPLGMNKALPYPRRLWIATINAFPFNLPVTIQMLAQRERTMHLYHASSQASAADAVRVEPVSDKREIYLFVLGETQRYDRWSLNGYERNTSPKLAKVKGLLSFRNVAALATATTRAVPPLITSANNYEETVVNFHDPQWNAPCSIQQVMKTAGFKTVWIGTYPSVGTTLIDYFANQCDERIIYGQMDGELISILETYLDRHRVEKNIFITIHQVGSHWRYSTRHPSQFDVFKPSALATYEGPAENLNNAYDNTILYGDFTLSEYLRVLARQDAHSFFLFVSDHGENLADDNQGRRLHGGAPTKFTIHVPLFVWMSPSYKKRFPSVALNIGRKLSAKISGADIFHSILDLARVRCGVWDETRSIASTKYKEHPRLISPDSGDLVDYDRLTPP